MCQTGNTAEHPKYSQAMGACECMELKPHGPGSTGKVSQLNNLASSHSTFVQCHAAAGFLASKASTASVHSQKALGPVSESIPVLLARSTDAYVPRRGGYLNSSKHAPTQVREKLEEAHTADRETCRHQEQVMKFFSVSCYHCSGVGLVQRRPCTWGRFLGSSGSVGPFSCSQVAASCHEVMQNLTPAHQASMSPGRTMSERGTQA